MLMAQELPRHFIRFIPLRFQQDHGWTFQTFPTAVGACDASLIPIQMSRRNPIQAKYYSGKHGTHGIKLQVVVSCNGIAMHAYVGKGNPHDITIFRESGAAELFRQMEYRGGRRQVVNHACLFDSGYQGVSSSVPNAIVAHRRPRGGELTESQVAQNNLIHTYRPIVENYFSRLKVYWQVLAHPSKNYETLPDVVLACVALTNVLVAHFPMRANRRSERPESNEEILLDVGNDPGVGWMELPDLMARLDITGESPSHRPPQARPSPPRTPATRRMVAVQQSQACYRALPQQLRRERVDIGEPVAPVPFEEEEMPVEEGSDTESEDHAETDTESDGSSEAQVHSEGWHFINEPADPGLRRRRPPMWHNDYEVQPKKRSRKK